MPLTPLPIDSLLPQLVTALCQHAALVLRAPTGAGKTTRVPPALLAGGVAGSGRLLLLEPRRLAARAAARRMASEHGCRVGADIGYQVRFERQWGPQTRIIAVTPGILLRWLQDDPYLEGIAAVLFDEFHERGLESDLTLGMVRLVQQTVRPELRLVVMSATLDVEAVAAYLGGCPILTSEGRQYPVEIVHEPRPTSQPWPLAAARAVQHLLRRTSGDVLVFLPGLQEIRQTKKHLEELPETRDLALLPLHGDLPAEQQDAALLPQAQRKVVLATNVAETSVTVEGVTAVVDTGLARLLHFDPHVGLDRLQLVPISRASAEQRSGRAGRLGPGICVRLWSAANHRQRPDQTEPEIRRLDLAGAVLQLLCLGESDIAKFPWLEPPPLAAVQQAFLLLQRLGALSDSGVTSLGRRLARLPVHPRLARLLTAGQQLGQPKRAALAAALLSERDPFTRSAAAPARPAERSPTDSDLLERVEAVERFEQTGQTESPLGQLHRGAVSFLLRARDQLLRLLRQETPKPANAPGAAIASDSDEVILRAVLAAFPDRVARRREPGSRKGIMVGGRGVQLAPFSGVMQAELFVCLDVDAGEREIFVRQASAIERGWLEPKDMRTTVEVAFDPAAERVAARRRVLYHDLLLEEAPAPLPEDNQAAQVLTEAAAQHLDKVLPQADSPAGNYLLRLRCLREWLPELNLPSFADGDLRELLPGLCQGCRSLAEVKKADWLSVLQGQLSYVQQQAVEREAPERLAVPSGSRLALQYEPGKPPVLAVRIQEVFSWHETPRIAGGRVPVLLHLLAPNYRPQQVTQDLASFWANTYPQVRKELRARYPKHAWPEDPLTATAERRPRRRQ